MSTRHEVIAVVAEVQAIPYLWPGPPDADSARRTGTGTCASKHALLAERLQRIGVASTPLLLIGDLVPACLRDAPGLREATDLLEVHECLTLHSRWAGPLLVDVTWDPPLIRAGLAGTLGWDGADDMDPAIGAHGPGWAVERRGLRDAKEALRARLYGPGQRARRDRALALISDRLESLRRS